MLVRPVSRGELHVGLPCGHDAPASRPPRMMPHGAASHREATMKTWVVVLVSVVVCSSAMPAMSATGNVAREGTNQALLVAEESAAGKAASETKEKAKTTTHKAKRHVT